MQNISNMSKGTTHQKIADIMRKSVKTNDHLEVLNEGIVTPLQKHLKKKKGEKKTNNLKPVILLSTVRKNFAICVIERIWENWKVIYQKIKQPTKKKETQPNKFCV